MDPGEVPRGNYLAKKIRLKGLKKIHPSPPFHSAPVPLIMESGAPTPVSICSDIFLTTQKTKTVLFHCASLMALNGSPVKKRHLNLRSAEVLRTWVLLDGLLKDLFWLSPVSTNVTVEPPSRKPPSKMRRQGVVAYRRLSLRRGPKLWIIQTCSNFYVQNNYQHKKL